MYTYSCIGTYVACQFVVYVSLRIFYVCLYVYIYVQRCIHIGQIRVLGVIMKFLRKFVYVTVNLLSRGHYVFSTYVQIYIQISFSPSRCHYEFFYVGKMLTLIVGMRSHPDFCISYGYISSLVYVWMSIWYISITDHVAGLHRILVYIDIYACLYRYICSNQRFKGGEGTCLNEECVFTCYVCVYIYLYIHIYIYIYTYIIQ